MFKNTLVTGGCGFVGRRVTLKLLELGAHVTVVDNLLVGQNPKLWIPEQYLDSDSFTFIEGDVRNYFREDTQTAFSHVFHLAAVVGGRAVIDGDPLAVATDLSIDADFYSWIVKRKPGKILYASSSAAYAINLQSEEKAVALKEEYLSFGYTLGQPDMTYGWSKMTGEYLAGIATKHYGLHICCVRPFSGYGEDQDETYPVPAIAARAVRKENPFDVWGTGDQGRDFVHIDDCVDAMLLAIEKISDGSAVNIGSGKLTTFREIISIFTSFAGYEPTIKPLLDKPVGVQSRYADITNMKSLLGWEPSISAEEGFKRVFDAVSNRILTNT